MFRFSIGQDSTHHLLALGLIASTFALTASRDVQAQTITYDTIALTGDAAPGTSVNFTFFFSTPVLNDAGQTAFRGFLTGTGVDSTNDLGIFSEFGGTLGLVARAGDAAPGTGPDVNFSFLINRNPLLNDAGQTAFVANLTGTGVDSTNDEAIFSEFGGTLGLVAREGNAAPGAGPGVNFGSLSPFPLLNDTGQTAFTATLIGTGVDGTNDSGIFSESGGTLGLVARAGNAAPGTGPGVNFGGSFGLSHPVLNDAGQTAFRGFLTGTGVDGTNDSGIFSESGTTLGLVARTGDAAPGTGPGVNFDGFARPVLNNAGQTAFRADLTGTGVDGTNFQAIFSESGGTLGLVARAGDAAPGTGPGVNFRTFGNYVLNNAGETAFRADLAGTGVDISNGSAIFSESGGTLRLVARAGDAAPGTGPGVIFGNLSTTAPAMNDAGQIAFLTDLTGPGVDRTSNFGIFATDRPGILQLIAREGDLFDVDPDPLVTENRTIDAVGLLSSSGGSDGRHRSFNNAGQLAFLLIFTDSTEGIFVATIAVPEPASLALLGVGCSALLGRRRW